jgi:hypothetical protein
LPFPVFVAFRRPAAAGSCRHVAQTGRILGPDEAGIVELASVQDAADGAVYGTKMTTLDALGAFRLAGIPGGAYVRTLRLGDDQIALRPIELGAGRA